MSDTEEAPDRDWTAPLFASLVFDILVQECGASEAERIDFCRLWPECGEYRFGGSLGFGGKVYHATRHDHVGYYSEDETPERRAAALKANERLQALAAGAGLSNIQGDGIDRQKGT